MNPETQRYLCNVLIVAMLVCAMLGIGAFVLCGCQTLIKDKVEIEKVAADALDEGITDLQTVEKAEAL